MIRGVATRAIVVPADPFVDVRSTTNIVTIGVAIASQDVNESGSDTSHVEVHGILRARTELPGNSAEIFNESGGTQMLWC